MEKQSLRIIHCVLGVPVSLVLCSFFLSLFIAHFLNQSFLFYFLCFFALSYVAKAKFLHDYQSLNFIFGGLPNHQLLIKGLPALFLDDIRKTIQSNRLVIVQCTNHPFLRKAIRHFIYSNAGFVEFNTSQDISLSSAELGPRVFLLSHRSKPALQESISHMLKRGWQLSGETMVETSFVDRIYMQSMRFEPSTDYPTA